MDEVVVSIRDSGVIWMHLKRLNTKIQKGSTPGIRVGVRPTAEAQWLTALKN